MQTTKQQLLALIKRTGAITVEEAAGALTVASMTARQHLLGLERDGLVLAEKVRGAMGRPHYLYSLTPKAEEMFPRRYDLLAQVLLDEVGGLNSDDIVSLSADEKRSLLILRTADRLAERYRVQVEGRSVGQRVAAVTGVLHLIGGFAEWHQTEDGYEIRDYNCVFAGLVATQHSDCAWHVRLITQLLGSPVRHEFLASGRSECCRYTVAVSEPQGVPANA